MFTLFLLITGHRKIINKSLSHYRFFYSAFLPRKCKSNICLCEVALLFFKDIPKTQQWPRIWQKQCKKKKNPKTCQELEVQPCSCCVFSNLLFTHIQPNPFDFGLQNSIESSIAQTVGASHLQRLHPDAGLLEWHTSPPCTAISHAYRYICMYVVGWFWGVFLPYLVLKISPQGGSNSQSPGELK